MEEVPWQFDDIEQFDQGVDRAWELSAKVLCYATCRRVQVAPAWGETPSSPRAGLGLLPEAGTSGARNRFRARRHPGR